MDRLHPQAPYQRRRAMRGSGDRRPHKAAEVTTRIYDFGIFEDVSIFGIAATAADVASSLGPLLAPMKTGTFVAAVIIQDDVPRADVGSLCETLIERGACYLLFFGPRGEEAHDIADIVREEVTVSNRAKFKAPAQDDVVMTIWDETLDPVDIIFETLCVATPTAGYLEEFASRLFVHIGSEAGATQVFECLRDPARSIREAVEREEMDG